MAARSELTLSAGTGLLLRMCLCWWMSGCSGGVASLATGSGWRSRSGGSTTSSRLHKMIRSVERRIAAKRWKGKDRWNGIIGELHQWLAIEQLSLRGHSQIEA